MLCYGGHYELGKCLIHKPHDLAFVVKHMHTFK